MHWTKCNHLVCTLVELLSFPLVFLLFTSSGLSFFLLCTFYVFWFCFPVFYILTIFFSQLLKEQLHTAVVVKEMGVAIALILGRSEHATVWEWVSKITDTIWNSFWNQKFHWNKFALAEIVLLLKYRSELRKQRTKNNVNLFPQEDGFGDNSRGVKKTFQHQRRASPTLVSTANTTTYSLLSIIMPKATVTDGCKAPNFRFQNLFITTSSLTL